MASLHLNQLRGSSTTKSTGEAIPRQSTRAFLGNGSHRQAAPSQSMTDFRTGQNFNHLKLTAEKMMQEQAGVKSDLQIMKTKLHKSEDQVRNLELKIQDMNNENAMLKVKHKQDMKLWMGLDSKFLSTTKFCDQLAETLQLLDCQVQEADRSKDYLEGKLAERLEFFESTEGRINGLLEKKAAAEDAVTQCEASNAKLQCTIREMERTILSDSIKFEKLAVEKNCLHQELTTAIQTNEDKEAVVSSNRCEIQDLKNEVICKAKEANDLQHLNFTIMHSKGELELELKALQSRVAATLKDNEDLQQELETCKLKIPDLEKLNASAAVNIENLLSDKAKLNQQSENDKIEQEKVVNELKQNLIEHQMNVEVIKHQLQDAIKEKERLVADVGEQESKFASLQDEINRLCQERTEKRELMSCISQNVESLRRENAKMQEQLTAAEEVAESLQVKFNEQLEFQKEASSKHLDDISQRHNQVIDSFFKNCKDERRIRSAKVAHHSPHAALEHQTLQEIASTRRKYEEEIKEAVAKEKLKGEAALKAMKKGSDEGMAKGMETFDKRWRSVQEDCERRIITLREAHEEEKMTIAAIHGDQINTMREQLHGVNETVRKLREGREEEKMKITTIHGDQIHSMREQLDGVNETIRKLREGHEEEKKKIVSIYSDEISKKEGELHAVKDRMSKLRLGHEDEKTKVVSTHSDDVRKLEEELHKVKKTIIKLREDHDQEKTKIVSVYSDEINKKKGELHTVKDTMSKLRLGHEDEKTHFVSTHSDEMHKLEVEFHILKETISKLREGHEQEKTKIITFHSQEINKMQEELRGGKEMSDGNNTELLNLQRKIEEITQSNREEMKKSLQDHQSQLKKITEEKSRVHEAMKKMQRAHEELLIRETQEQKAQFEKLAKDQQVQSHNAQNSLNQEINELRSKAFTLEIELKEALQQIDTNKASKEDKCIQTVNEDWKMMVTEELISKDIPTPIVTPITKDRDPQQTNQRLTAKRIMIDLADTTDDSDAEEGTKKQAPQGKGHIQRSPRPGKRKVDVKGPPKKAPRVNTRTSRKKVTLDIHHRMATQQDQASTDSTKATGDGSSGKKFTLVEKDNEPQQQQPVLRQQSVDEPRRKTGFSSTQESDLHPMPGPTHLKGIGHEILGLSSQGKSITPKQRLRKAIKDVTQDKNQFTKSLSPAISDLFQMEGLVPYYKGDDPYALD